MITNRTLEIKKQIADNPLNIENLSDAMFLELIENCNPTADEFQNMMDACTITPGMFYYILRRIGAFTPKQDNHTSLKISELQKSLNSTEFQEKLKQLGEFTRSNLPA